MANSSEEGERWFVIYCEEDDSHSLVSVDCVICDDSVKVGDGVKFSMSIRDKRLHNGVVAAMGVNHTAMRKLMEHFNHKSKPSREPSFHEDQPRRAAVRCMQKVAKPLTRSLSTAKANKSGPSKEKSKSRTKTSGTENSKDQRKKSSDMSKKTGIFAQRVSSPPMLMSEKSKPISAQSIYSSGDSSNDESDNSTYNKQCTKKPEEGSAVSLSSDVGATDEDDDCKSSEEELTAEEIEFLKKIQLKKKKKDLQSLCDLALKPTASPKPPAKRTSVMQEEFELKRLKHISSEPEKEVTINESRQTIDEGIPLLDHNDIMVKSHANKMTIGQSKQPSKMEVIKTLNGKDKNTEQIESVNCVEITDDEVADTNSEKHLRDDKESKSEQKAPVLSARSRWRQRERLVFQGEYFRYKATDEKVDKLSEDHNVYILHRSLKDIKTRCKSSTALACSLTREIFTDEALAACSVSGKPSSGKGKDKTEVRPPLHPEGVEAILDFIKNRAIKKNWDPPNFTYIKLQMGNMLCEDRLSIKMMEAASKQA